MIDPAATAAIDYQTASAEIDLAALRANVAALAARAAPAALMVVVKADAYGHGLLPCAAAARQAGAPWLGVAAPGEALTLREAGDTGPLLAWLYGPDTDLSPLVAADVDISASRAEQVSALVGAAAVAERPARVHLKIDTGLSRNGATIADWPDLCATAAEAERTGALRVVGLWTHLAEADRPGAPSVTRQLERFAAADRVATDAGLRPDLRHASNSPGVLTAPEARFDLVRVGVAAYGVDPGDDRLAEAAGVPLRPVMRLRAQLVHVKRIGPGTGVSYGLTWTADRPTVVGLVPLGYADGVPRQASNRAAVGWRGGLAALRGRVCMDQFVVEVDDRARVGDEVVLFGPGDAGEPTAVEWAGWADTIGYDVVTGVGPRVPRVYLDSPNQAD